MPASIAGSRFRACRVVRPDDGGVVAARLEAGHASAAEVSRATIIGGLSLAAAIAIGVVGIEVADELLVQAAAVRRRQPGRAPRDAGRGGLAGGVEGAPRLRDLAAVPQDGGGTRRRACERAQRAHRRGPRRSPPRGGDYRVGVSAQPRGAGVGRPLQPTDEYRVRSPSWSWGTTLQKQFLHDPAIIGRVVTVGRTARTVVGVMPPRFGFPRNQEIWVPLAVQDAPPREGRPCRCSAASPTERAGGMPRPRSTSSRRAPPPTSRPLTRSCGHASAHSPGSRR